MVRKPWLGKDKAEKTLPEQTFLPSCIFIQLCYTSLLSTLAHSDYPMAAHLNSDSTQTTSGLLRHYTLLLVDDDATNLKILTHTLSRLPHHLLTATSGEEALALARIHRPDMILLDVMMPGLDGYQTCTQLKQDPLTRQGVVIFLSALDDADAKVKGFEQGAVDYISKPFQLREVIARVETHLRIKQLETTLALENRALANLQERLLYAIDDGICGLDIHGDIQFVNPSVAKLTGWNERQLLGKSFIQLLLMDHEITPPYDTPVYQTCQYGQSFKNATTTMLRKDGTYFSIEYNVTPLLEDSQITGAVVIFHDITQRLKYEKALRDAEQDAHRHRERLAQINRLHSMGQMAAAIAHEVNQPLTAINNYANACKMMCKSDQPSPKLTDTLAKLSNQALRASAVVQRLRGFVKKPDEGKALIEINQLLNELIRFAEVDAQQNQTSIDLQLFPDPLHVLVDPIQIQQVVLNLLRNAMEANRNAPPHSKDVILQSRPHLNTHVEVQVIDQGAGLSPEIAASLFQPFNSSKHDGMGIGLSVCHTIIHAHQGDIGYRPNPEGGCIFYFLLPRESDYTH